MPSTVRKNLLASAAALAAVAAMPAANAQAVYSFGDSLSDSGSVNDLSLGLFAGSDYFAGRFSNFYLWTDYLSALSAGVEQRRNQGLVGPFLEVTADGYNFAHGGAVSGRLGPNVNTSLFGGDLGFLSTLPAFRVTDQAEHFRDTRVFFQRAFTVNPNDFATISAGGNDYFNGETDVNLVVGNIMTAVTAIREAGVQYMIVLDVPNVGDVPRRFGTPEQGALNALSAAHNAALQVATTEFEANDPSSLVVVARASRLFELIIDDAFNNNGGVFGFTDVAPSATSTGNCLGDGLVLDACPDTYLFYDDIHPTGRAHALMAELTIATVRARLAGEAEPLSQSEAANQVTAADGGVITSRLAALRLGKTGTGYFHDGAAAGVASATGARLSFETLDGPSSNLSIYGRVQGNPLTAAGLDPLLTIQEGATHADLTFGPGEGLASIGADMLWNSRFASGILVTRAAFNRDAFGYQRQDEGTAYNIYAAAFEGPITASFTSRYTESDQTYQRATGLSYAPVQYGRSEMKTAQSIAQGEYALLDGPVQVALVGRAASTDVDLERSAETGTLGLLDRDASREQFQSKAYFAGVRTDFAVPFSHNTTRMSVDLAHVNASDHIIGLSPVIPDTELFRVGNDVPLTFGDRVNAPMEDQSGSYASVSLGFARGPVTISARSSLINTETETSALAKVGFNWQF